MTSILFLNSSHLILPPALFFLQLLIKTPLQTFTYFSLLFYIYNISTTNQYSLIVTSMRAITNSKVMNLLGLSFILGTGMGYYKVNEINKTLGNQILEYSLKKLREDLEIDNKTFNEDNQLHFIIEQVSNQIQIAKRRLSVYLSRLINVGKYEKTCQQINKNVIAPLIRNYETENIFQYSDIIQEFKEKSQFNNKLASVLMSIQQKNQKIKGQNKLLLQIFYELQQQLLTAHIFDLEDLNKNKIGLIYSYFRQRERFATNLTKKQIKTEYSPKEENIPQKEAWIDEINYGFKVQYL